MTSSTAAANAFVRGYQEALSDLVDANERGGIADVYAWIRDNLSDPEVRARLDNAPATT